MSHYLQLSCKNFSQHTTFTLVSFDMVSRKRALMASRISCKSRPENIAAIAAVTSTELSRKLKQDIRVRKELQNGVSCTAYGKSRKQKTNPEAEKLLKTVEVAAGFFYATNEERALYLRKAMSISSRHDGAALFITFSPDDYDSTVLSFSLEILQLIR